MKYLSDYIQNCLADGKYFFTSEEALLNLQLSTEQFRHQAYRLAKKKLVRRLIQDFFIIIPAEYSHLGNLPPHWIIDPLMHYLGQGYYIGLLSAAALYGATHHQPMVFQVITSQPIRQIKLARGNIEFHMFKDLTSAYIKQISSPAGYANISGKEQTMLDLVRFYKVAGYLSNIAIIIKELSNDIDERTLTVVIKKERNNSVLQRLGYIFELLNQEIFASCIEKELSQRKTQFIRLRPDFHDKVGMHNTRFKLIINDTIELEE